MALGPGELRRRMEATLDRYHGLGQEPLVEPLATFTVDHDRADVWDANQIRSPRASTPDQIERLLERVEEIYAGHGHRRLMCDLDTPDLLEARLVLDGWRIDLTLQHLLDDDLRSPQRAPGLAIDPVRSDGDWDELRRVTRLDHLEEATKEGRDPWPEELTARMVDHKRRKAPEMQPWLASIDGEVVGMLSSMPGVDGIGLVEDLFVAPGARGRKVAQALIVHATADARRRGAGPVIIGSLPGDWPRLLYARMGFRPTFLERGWGLDVAPPDTPSPA